MAWIIKAVVIFILSVVSSTSGMLVRSREHVKARQNLLMFLGKLQ